MLTKMKHWQDPLNLVLGIWLIASPWALAYQDEAMAMPNAVIVGGLIVILAALELFTVKAWEEWTSFALGIWLAISPWVLGFDYVVPAMANALIVGLAVAALALWALGTDKDIGGWWSRHHPTTQ